MVNLLYKDIKLAEKDREIRPEVLKQLVIAYIGTC